MKKFIEWFKRLPFMVAYYKMKYPSYSCCDHCGLPWAVCKNKCIDINDHEGVFYVCQHCWDNCTLEEVLEASRKGWLMQKASCDKAGYGTRFEIEYSYEMIMKKVKELYIKEHENN